MYNGHDFQYLSTKVHNDIVDAFENKQTQALISEYSPPVHFNLEST